MPNNNRLNRRYADFEPPSYTNRKKKRGRVRRTRSAASLDQSSGSSGLDRSFRSNRRSIKASHSTSNLRRSSPDYTDINDSMSIKVACVNTGGDPRDMEARKRKAKSLIFEAKGSVKPDILIVLDGWSDPRVHIGGLSDFEFAPRVAKGGDSKVCVMWRKKLFKHRSVRDVWDWDKLKTKTEKFPQLNWEHIHEKIAFVALDAPDNFRILVAGWIGPMRKTTPQKGLEQAKDFISLVSAFIEEEEKFSHVIIGAEFGCDLSASLRAVNSNLKLSTFVCPQAGICEEGLFSKDPQTHFLLHSGPRFQCTQMGATSARPLCHPIIHGTLRVNSSRSKPSVASMDLMKLAEEARENGDEYRSLLKSIEKKIQMMQRKEADAEKKNIKDEDVPNGKKKKKAPPSKNYFAFNSSEDALKKISAQIIQMESDHKQEKLALLSAFKDKL